MARIPLPLFLVAAFVAAPFASAVPTGPRAPAALAAGSFPHAAPAALVAESLPRAAPAGGWLRPVDGPVLRAFGVGANPYARGQHRGVDLAAAPGTPVRGACGGRVGFAGRVPGGGLTVSVRCGAIIATYQQLGTIVRRRGQRVERGGRLGTVGPSSDPRMPRAHLHLGARDAATRRYLDPLKLLGRSYPGVVPLLTPRPGRPGPAPSGRAPAWPRFAPVGRVSVPVVPRLAPLGRGPVLALEPAPSLRLTPARPLGPELSRPAPDPTDGPPSAVPGIPWFVWVGLAAFGLGLPIGGLATYGRHRRAVRRRVAAGAGRAA